MSSDQQDIWKTYWETVFAAHRKAEARLSALIEQSRQAHEKAKSKRRAKARPSVPVSSRKYLWNLYGKKCFFCSLNIAWQAVTIDHLVPKSKGGRAGHNLVPACFPCNNLKGDRLPTDEERARVKLG